MNGWQRFGLLILGCFAIMVLYPDFDKTGLHFIGMTLLIGTAGIFLLSVLSNVFAIYRFELLNKLITLGVLALISYVLLWHFPQTDRVAPVDKLRAGQTPTKADLQKGIRQLTFNFDFVRRNVRREENFSNQHANQPQTKPAKAPAQPAAKADDVMEVLPEEE